MPSTSRFHLGIATVVLLGSLAGIDVTGADPLQVYILAGQSNMQGHVNIATFDSLKSDPKTAPLLADMRDAQGKPVTCKNVWISSIGCAEDDTTEQTGRVTAGFGASTDKIGPEFTFGIYLEKQIKKPILIIKTSWGGRDLHTAFRPPSAGPYVWSDFELERRKEEGAPLEKLKADKIAETGVSYRLMIAHVKKVLADLKRVVPDYDPKQGYELAGFVWFQGFNDLVSEWTYDKGDQPGGYDLYGELLTHLIKDVRADLQAPTLPVVIGVMGIGGLKEEQKPSRMLHFRTAMRSPSLRPEFKGSVVAVPTAPFWDDELEALQERMESHWPAVDEAVKADQDESWENKMKYMAKHFTPEQWQRLQAGVSDAAYHYLGAAKIMAPIGKAFADAVVKLRH
jgi:alpha-galactosidase